MIETVTVSDTHRDIQNTVKSNLYITDNDSKNGSHRQSQAWDTGSCGQAGSTVIESETDGCNEVTLTVTELDISSHRYT